MTGPGSARVEAVLRRALVDPAFRADLGARRSAAALAAGFELTAAERAVLDAIGAEQLEATLASLPPEPRPVPVSDVPETTLGIRPEIPAPQGIRPDVPVVRGSTPDHPPIAKGNRPGIPVVIAAGAVLAGGAAFAVCATAGVRPDVPRPAPVTAPKSSAPVTAPKASAPAAAPAPAPAPASAPAAAADASTDPPTRR